jgi:hypothetical protein
MSTRESIDYPDFAWALGQAESKFNLEAWGDGGRACGAYQMHPAFVWQWGPDVVPVGWNWADLFDTCLENFWLAAAKPVDFEKARALATGFHLHGQPNEKPEPDPEHDKRFTAALEQRLKAG